MRNQNAVKHGGYCQVFRDTLTNEEWEMLGKMSLDLEQLLIDEISLLTILENRLMEILGDLNSTPSGQIVCSVTKQGSFEVNDDLPGKPYIQTTHTEAMYLILCKLDRALRHCSEIKLRYIECLMALQLQCREYSGRYSHDIGKVERTLENITKYL